MRSIVFSLMTARTVCTATPAAATWHEARSKHFIIYSDSSPHELTEFASNVEKFDSAVRLARHMDDPPLGEGGRLTVYVLRDAPAVAAMAGSPKSNIAGFYVPRASGSIAFVHRDRENVSPQLKFIMKLLPESQQWTPTDPQTVFFHEYFHHLMLGSANAALPKWIVEGFAEYYSTATFEADGSVILGRPAAHRSTSLFGKTKISLEELLGRPTRAYTNDETAEFYARGWLLTHYLSTQEKRSGQLRAYLQALQRGRPSMDAAREAFGDLKVLQSELDHYLKSDDMAAYRVPAELVKVGTVAIRDLRPGEEEMMPIRMRSDYGVDGKTAGPVAAQARAIGARYPNDLFVQGALAEAELDAGNVPAAIAAADRALAVDPKNLQAIVYKGRALLERARQNTQSANWAEVRSWFVKANKLDPEYAEPLMLYYRSYQAAKLPAPDSAVEGLLYAVDLAPQDSWLRSDAVRELLARNRFDEAKALFGPIAFNPHATPEWRERNLAIMGLIEQSKAREALALMDAPAPKAPAAAASKTN